MLKRLQHAVSCLMLCVLLLPCMTAPAAAAGFSDVPASHWAAASIQRCVELGFFQGESATRFGLGHPMTRASFAVVLSRFFGWKAEKAAESVYNDVPAGAWYAAAARWAADGQIVLGDNGSFRPSSGITREALATLLYRYAASMGYDTSVRADLSRFSDAANVSAYAADAISWAVAAGIINGKSNGTLAPLGTATRAETAKMLVSFMDAMGI